VYPVHCNPIHINTVSNHCQLVRYEKTDKNYMYRYVQNNNISKNNLCKQCVSSRWIPSEVFWSADWGHRGVMSGIKMSIFQIYLKRRIFFTRVKYSVKKSFGPYHVKPYLTQPGAWILDTEFIQKYFWAAQAHRK
jgi:hypothetical protein